MTLKVIYLVSLSKYRSTGRQLVLRPKKKGEELDQQMVSSEWKIKLQGGAPKIAKLVYNSNNYGLWYL